MWKKLDLEQFFEKYSQNLKSQKTTEKIEKNQNPDYVENLRPISIQKKRSKRNKLNTVKKEVKPHRENTRKNYLKSSSKNSNAQKFTGLTKHAIEKKKEGRILQDEIKELEDKLRKIINQKNRQNTISYLREYILIKKEKLEKIVNSSHVTVIRSNDKSANKDDLEINKVLKKCPHCLVSILDKNLLHHIETKCPYSFDSKVNQKPNSGETKLVVEYVSWKLLPKGEWLSQHLSNHFRHLNLKKKWKKKVFDQTRFKKIERNLHPNKCFVGKDEFESYIVYCFDWTDKVILECPLYGNATYVIKPGEFTWKDIAKESKWEVRTEHSDQVTVINHSETWIERLEQNLKYGL